MSQLGPQIADQILNACRRGAAEASKTLSAVLKREVAIEAADARPIGAADEVSDMHGPGLAIVLRVGDTGVLLLLGESTGLLPDWYANRDTTSTQKLSSLAEQLGDQLLPDELSPTATNVGHVPDLAEAIKRGELATHAHEIPLHLTSPDKQGTFRMIWPVARLDAVFATGTTDSGESSGETDSAADSQTGSKFHDGPPPGWIDRSQLFDGDDGLKAYSRSLLKIKVPVSVTLASARKPIGQIVELGPGAILQFDKSCEEMLQLRVGDHVVAEGEAVKVGEKFGLRVLSLVSPDERFHSVVQGQQKKRPA